MKAGKGAVCGCDQSTEYINQNFQSQSPDSFQAVYNFIMFTHSDWRLFSRPSPESQLYCQMQPCSHSSNGRFYAFLASQRLFLCCTLIPRFYWNHRDSVAYSVFTGIIVFSDVVIMSLCTLFFHLLFKHGYSTFQIHD